MSERRFTDQDVALILRRATELDSRTTPDAQPRGLSLGELQEIAGEVGIDPAMVTRAVAELDRRSAPSRSLIMGPATTHQEVRAVPVRLSREELSELIREVDARVPAQGTVTEALGSVRWNSQGRFLSRQVSLEPGDEETVIRVEERYADRVQGLIHMIPAFYGAMTGFVIGLEGMGAAGLGVLLGATLGAGSWALGGGVWRFMAARSRARVRELAEALGVRADPAGDRGAESTSTLTPPG